MLARRRLGRSDLEVSPIGLGCWQFSEGFGLAGGFWEALPEATVQEIVQTSLRGGINWFDTAQVYGSGRSERALAKALTAAGKRPGEVVVATKWWPTLKLASNLESTLNARLEALAPFPIDLHQIHHPFSLASVTAQSKVLARLVREQRVRAVGVSNFSARGMRKAHAVLAAEGIPLATMQMELSLLNRTVERSGVLAACKELGVTLIAYSPLAQGLLSGKFHDDPSSIQQRAGPRRYMRAFRPRGLARTRPLIDALREIAKAHGVTPSQVALAWVLQFHGDGVVAIPGASKVKHAEENVGALGLRLSRLELDRLDGLSR